MLSWLFVGALLALCGVLGALQYHWIGEVTVAARDRLRGTLQASLVRTSLDFNSEILSACSAILPPSAAMDVKELRQQISARYLDWKKNARQSQIFRGVALAVPLARSLQLQILDLNSGLFANSEWPASWENTFKHLEANRTWLGGGPPPPPSGDPGTQGASEGTTFDFAIFSPHAPPSQAGFRRPQVAWVVFDVNPEYVRDAVLPEILQRHLGTGGSLDYQVVVVSKAGPNSTIYRAPV